MRHAFGKLLQLIVPLCGSLRVFYRNHEDVANVLFVHEFLLLVGKRIRRDICFRVLLAVICTAERAERHGRHRLVRRIEHETRNLLCCQAGCKVCGALLNGQTPIFIREKLAGLLQVFKIQAVFFDELYAGRRRPRERLAVFGIGADNAVSLCLFLREKPLHGGFQVFQYKSFFRVRTGGKAVSGAQRKAGVVV